MAVLVRAIKAARVTVMLVGLVLMLWMYAYLPESVVLMHDMTRSPDTEMLVGKGPFFYVFLLLFAFVNAVFMMYFNILVSRGFSEEGRSAVSFTRRPSYILWIGLMHLVVQAFLLLAWLHITLRNASEVTFYSGNQLLVAALVTLISGILLWPVLKVAVAGNTS